MKSKMKWKPLLVRNLLVNIS